jgi:hypothetical protein
VYAQIFFLLSLHFHGYLQEKPDVGYLDERTSRCSFVVPFPLSIVWLLIVRYLTAIKRMKEMGNVKSNAYFNPNEIKNPPPTNMIEQERDSDLEKYIRGTGIRYPQFRFLLTYARQVRVQEVP